MKVSAARSELASVEAQLQSVENESREIISNNATTREIESRIANLRKYSTKRFFWSSALDAVQRTLVNDVRLVGLHSSQAYLTNAEVRFKTNKIVMVEKSSRWLPWGASRPTTNVHDLVAGQIVALTNRTELLTNQVRLLPPKIDITTNEYSVNAQIEIVKPAAMTEQIALTFRARDYGTPPGKQVDEFLRAIAQVPYFRDRLHKGEGQAIWLRERSIQPKTDPDDPLDPDRPFIPFTVECRYADVVRCNEAHP
jgi:hypothetical protein